MRTTEKEGTLLRELAAILRDYQDRIDRIGPEAFRLRGESFEAWDRKRGRIAQVLQLLERAAEVVARGAGDEELEALAREVAEAPEVPLPSGTLDAIAAGNVAALRDHLARLHREHPAACEGERCPCRGPQGTREEGRP